MKITVPLLRGLWMTTEEMSFQSSGSHVPFQPTQQHRGSRLEKPTMGHPLPPSCYSVRPPPLAGRRRCEAIATAVFGRVRRAVAGVELRPVVLSPSSPSSKLSVRFRESMASSAASRSALSNASSRELLDDLVASAAECDGSIETALDCP